MSAEGKAKFQWLARAGGGPIGYGGWLLTCTRWALLLFMAPDIQNIAFSLSILCVKSVLQAIIYF